MPRPTRRPALVAAVGIAGLFAPLPAAAHWSASYNRSIFVERYLVCDGDLDARCVGPIAAKPELMRALELGPIEVDRNNDAVIDPARDAAVMAAYFNFQDATGPLRTMLALPMPAGAKDTHTEMEIQALRAEAAYALAELGDDASTETIAKLVREFETEGYGSLWADTLAALTQLSPTRASTYSRDFLGRIELQDMRMSMPGGSSQLEALAPIVLAHDRAALTVLKRLTQGDDATSGGSPGIPLTDSHAWCRFMSTRLALDEQPLVADVRKAFAGSYSGTMVASCDNQFLKTYGDDAADVDILLRHVGRDDLGFDAGMSLVAYDRILALIPTLDRGSLAGRHARDRLRKGLRERAKYPHVGDPTHTNFGTHFVALHHAALAGLGDQDSRAIVRAMITDPHDLSGVGDLAALRALQLDLPGAVDDAAARLALDVAFTNDDRSGIFEALRPRLLEAMIRRAPDDPRWAVALIDAEIVVRERAMHAFSRHAPAGACDAVIAASDAATDRGIDDGYLVLTTAGRGCADEFTRIAAHVRAPAKVRGMALEALAVLGRTSKRQLDDAARSDDLRVHVERARAIGQALARRGKHR